MDVTAGANREVPRRPVLVSIAVGVGVGLCAIAIAFSFIAIPLYALARVEPGSGLDRPFIRDGLTHVAIPVGVVLGLIAGALVGIWYARGGHLPEAPRDER
jgi:hypothetical protein